MRKIILILLACLLSSCGGGPTYNGYVDADLVYLSADYPGRLESLAVVRGQEINKDQLLFKLEQAPEYFGVGVSEFSKQSLVAQREQIISQIRYGETNYQRATRMRRQDAASQNDVDVAKKDLDVLKNQLAAIDFQIKSSDVDTLDKRWRVMRKASYAPDPGIIFDTYFTKGEYVQAGQPVVSLVTKRNIKVIFFVPEDQLSRVFLNEKVKITSDGNKKAKDGIISYISNTAQYTPPIIYSREDRHALVFRVEARIDTPKLTQIHLGQPVSLELIR